MFGFDWSELMIIVVVALIVLGPKDLPRALYQLGKWTRHARRITSEFQRHVDDIVRQAELEEVRKTVQDAAKTMDVRGQVAEHVNTVLDPVRDIKQAFDKAAPGATPRAEPDRAAPNGAAAPPAAEPRRVEGPQPVEGPKPAEPEAPAEPAPAAVPASPAAVPVAAPAPAAAPTPTDRAS
ncbi:Sec-independent protein translocase protein TatB [Inquilinus sp. Marseille-Q2685]|uniref:Sec-independent protein translocase protein TatB n=1 Tax=Inquilinus sp. Marseille-Q2685 TaxID=2866581 RepID=UPI001CE48966|nr:Sec-independent protein translocase protein TatB [Inquilinus sp. Marseille-Q2685]